MPTRQLTMDGGVQITANANEGAENWDDCGISMVCCQGACTQTCTLGGAGCASPRQCMQDPDVGAQVLGVCVP